MNEELRPKDNCPGRKGCSEEDRSREERKPKLTLDIIIAKGLWLVLEPLEITLDRVWSKSTPSFVFRFFLLGRHYCCDKTWILLVSMNQ